MEALDKQHLCGLVFQYNLQKDDSYLLKVKLITKKNKRLKSFINLNNNCGVTGWFCWMSYVGESGGSLF